MIDSLDIQTLQKAYESGTLQPADVLAEVMARIEKYTDPAVWIDRFPKALIDSQLAAAMQRKREGKPQPLLGIPFAVKDNIDFAGRPTTAACPAFAYVAKESATVVQMLCDAGAIAVGKTNLDQFATGLVGTRSPYGACVNPFDSKYISGGSSSGSAVAVSAGLVSFALATDTAGSGRVPAAFNNIVGLKPTRGLLSNRGLVPACRSIDCVSILSLNCDDARTVMKIIEAYDPSDPYSHRRSEFAAPPRSIPPAGFTFGVLRDSALRFFGNSHAETNYRQSIERAIRLGGRPIEIDFAPFARAAELLYEGPWVVERYLVAKELLEKQPSAILPVIATILDNGRTYTALHVFEATYELESLRRAARIEWEKMDCMLVPTTGSVYTIAEVEADPIVLNSNLGYYTNFLNLMDLCAVAVPSGFQENGLPTGVSIIGPAGTELELLEIADKLHRALGIGPGVARQPLPPAMARSAPALTRARLAVVGAHLSGMPLNHQLTERGATLIRQARTAPMYRLYALPGTKPPKPGLIRSENGGHSIELEIWEMSLEAFGSFVAAIPPPLGVGSVALEDGQSVQGFICETYATQGAQDISHFGGWRAFIRSQK